MLLIKSDSLSGFFFKILIIHGFFYSQIANLDNEFGPSLPHDNQLLRCEMENARKCDEMIVKLFTAMCFWKIAVKMEEKWKN